jgi:hypothetical protein
MGSLVVILDGKVWQLLARDCIFLSLWRSVNLVTLMYSRLIACVFIVNRNNSGRETQSVSMIDAN